MRILVSTLACVIFVSGCSTAAEDAQGDGEGSGEQGSRDAGTPDSWDEIFGGASIEEVVEEQRQEYRESNPNIPDPREVPLVRMVSAAEEPSLQVECMEEAGFAATAAPDGTVRYPDVPADQAEALNQAAYVCTMSYWVDPRESSYQLPEGVAGVLYDYFVQEAVPCLEESGNPVDKDIPSKQAWVEARGRGEVTWSPFDAITRSQPSPERWTAVIEQCPELPPDFASNW